jgi:hypothetical protein
VNLVTVRRRPVRVRRIAYALPAALLIALATGCAPRSGATIGTPVVPSQTPTSSPVVILPTATEQAPSTATATPLIPTPTAVPATPTARPSPTIAPTRTPTSDPVANWKTYSNAAYGVTLRYPAGWSRDPRYDQPNAERYVGPGGFFQVSASSADSLDAAAGGEASHALHPYGNHPTITSLEVAGPGARLILPSSDQPPEMTGQAALIVVSPRPIKLGTATYPYLVLWADQGHLKTIASTLGFAGVP